MRKTFFSGILFLLLTGLLMAQRFGGRRGGFGGYGGEGGYIPESAQTAREVPSHSTGTPEWSNPAGFDKDVFTFVRVRRERNPNSSGASWQTDTPDSDLILSFRLQQMTSMKVNPDGRFLRLTDEHLADYPFIYMVEPGSLYLNEEEIVALRNYLRNGGSLMLDDFWGEAEWANAERVLKQVLPDRGFTELPMEHPLYHCVFQINAKAQVPGISYWERSGGDTAERPDARIVHHRAIFDDRGHIMVIATHNTDNGDGWEREGENSEYFRNFSEKISYPLGINIIFYQMTH